MILFILLAIALKLVDVLPIGPLGTKVGFACVNQAVHNLTGVHMNLYEWTDWLSIIAFMVVFIFAFIGIIQLIKRRSLLKVDRSIPLLGGFYLIVLGCYFLFERIIINYRPILIENKLEASYPSSTTMLVTCVMLTAMIEFHIIIKNKAFRAVLNSLCTLYAIFMVTARLISGVHWFTDICGGMILSISLSLLYYGGIHAFPNKSSIDTNS